MSKVIAVVGKIGCGMSFYVNILKDREKAILFANDDIVKSLFTSSNLDFDLFIKQANDYLLNKSVEFLDKGNDIILNWGFSKKSQRDYIRKFYNELGYSIVWHYIDVDDITLSKNIELDKKIQFNSFAEKSFFSDEFITNNNKEFEIPDKSEIDVWYKPVR